MGRTDFGFFVGEDKYHCWYCKEVKNISQFVKDNSKKIGFKTKCKECYNDYMREYRNMNKRVEELIDYYEKSKKKNE